MKYILIVLLGLLSFSTKAQQDTIHLPYSVAKQIIKDLVVCDSAKAILELTKEQLTLTESKVALKDSIISNYIKKDTIYEERIKNEQLKFDAQGKFVEQLRTKNKKLKVKLLFTKVTFGAVIGGLTYLYITK